jgi:hypothetical protein
MERLPFYHAGTMLVRLVAISGKLASKFGFALPSTDDGVDAFLKSALR